MIARLRIVAIVLAVGPCLSCDRGPTGGRGVSTTRGHKAWTDAVLDRHGVVLARRRGTTYQSFVIVEPNRVSEIGDFRNPRVETQSFGGRDLVKITYTASFGTGLHHERMVVIALEDHVTAKFVNIPSGGHTGREWGRGDRSVRIGEMSLADDMLHVQYLLSEDGSPQQEIAKRYGLSSDPQAWADCPSVWQYLGPSVD